MGVCVCKAQRNDHNIDYSPKFPPSLPPSSIASFSNGSSWLPELTHGISKSNQQLKYSWSEDGKLNFAHESQFGRSLQLQPKRWDSTTHDDHLKWEDTLRYRGAQGFPYLFTTPPKRRYVMRVDAKVLKDSGRTALAGKNKSGPQGYLPLPLQGAGSCSSPPKAERTPGRARGTGSMHGEADCPGVGLKGRRVLKAGLWSRGKSIRVKKLAGHFLRHQLGGPVAKSNLGYWPCPFFTSINKTIMTEVIFKGFYSKFG